MCTSCGGCDWKTSPSTLGGKLGALWPYAGDDPSLVAWHISGNGAGHFDSALPNVQKQKPQMMTLSILQRDSHRLLKGLNSCKAAPLESLLFHPKTLS